jgi:hypothetical protein
MAVKIVKPAGCPATSILVNDVKQNVYVPTGLVTLMRVHAPAPLLADASNNHRRPIDRSIHHKTNTVQEFNHIRSTKVRSFPTNIGCKAVVRPSQVHGHTIL